MYQNKFVVAIKVGGRILRELGDTVTIPFGSEYSVLVKNLHTVRAKFKISIDGESTDAGGWFVVGPNASVEIERFLKDGDFSRGRKFKFIERTAAVEDHRGIKAEDGLVRVEYQFEQPVVNLFPYTHYYHPSGGGSVGNNNWPYDQFQNSNYSSGSTTGEQMRSKGLTRSLTSCNVAFAAAAGAPANDAGITVAGGESKQQFVNVLDFPTGPSEAIVLRLRGRVNEKPVQVARTVTRKLYCSSCDQQSKSSAEFCSRCGTSLVD